MSREAEMLFHCEKDKGGTKVVGHRRGRRSFEEQGLAGVCGVGRALVDWRVAQGGISREKYLID